VEVTVSLFDKRKENRRLNKQDREARREAAADALEIKRGWSQKATDLSAQYADAIQAASTVDIRELQRTAERFQRISSHGVPGKAVVVSARAVSEGVAGVGVTLELKLDLITGPSAPRRMTIRQDVMGSVESYPAGLELPVRLDPDDHGDAIIWADAQPDDAAIPGARGYNPGTDRLTHLEAIAQLRARGVLSEEQLRQAKARLLADE
jgi:hypothetical protein